MTGSGSTASSPRAVVSTQRSSLSRVNRSMTGVSCEPMTFMPGTDDTASNPTVIIEVLSKSTEAYDRGKKFEHYRQLPSLREYVLVSQDTPVIERFTRESDDRWVLTTARGLAAVLPLPVIEAELPLAEVYDKVGFNPPTANA